MTNFFLYGNAKTPTFIYGKFSREQLNPEYTQLFNSVDADARSVLDFQASRHEMWFSTTINFIPHGSSPVFVTDVQGNVTHDGNLLTKRDITVNGSSTFLGPSTFIAPSTFKNDVTVEQTLFARQDIRIARDLYVQGRIFSPQIATAQDITDIRRDIDGLATTEDLEDIRREIEELKRNIENIASE
jgi:hypothetical protein